MMDETSEFYILYSIKQITTSIVTSSTISNGTSDRDFP